MNDEDFDFLEQQMGSKARDELLDAIKAGLLCFTCIAWMIWLILLGCAIPIVIVAWRWAL